MSRKYQKDEAKIKGRLHDFWDDRRVKDKNIEDHSRPITVKRNKGWFTRFLELINILSRGADDN